MPKTQWAKTPVMNAKIIGISSNHATATVATISTTAIPKIRPRVLCGSVISDGLKSNSELRLSNPKAVNKEELI